MPRPKIAIIGAGPAGLTLACLFGKHGVPCTVYESERDRHSRNQGGTLDLHPKAGQRALKEAGLFEKFLEHCRPEAQAIRFMRPDGSIIYDENVEGNERPMDYNDRPEIDRDVLRGLLLDAIEPDVIKWNHRVLSVEADPRKRGKTVVSFVDGSRETDIDLLVGADGAWSKVRPLVSDQQPVYSGISALELWSLNVSGSNPWLSEYVGAGSNYMFDEGRAVMCQRLGNDSVRVYGCVRQPLSWKDECGISWMDRKQACEAMVEKCFVDCGADIKRSILETHDENVFRQLWMLPIGHKWDSCPGVTLVGDAAHLMTPFAGVGVNLAMLDALKLAQVLVSRKDSFVARAFSDSHNIQAAVKEYEKDMFPRSKEYAQRTYDGMVEHFSRDGGSMMVDRIKLARKGWKSEHRQ